MTILTPEQVTTIRSSQYISVNGEELLTPVAQLCNSHEALRAGLVVAIENWQAQAEHDAERLADAQTDLRALGEALQAITRGEGPYNRYPDLYLQGVIANGIQIAEEALARPGVKAVMEDAGAGLKAAVQAAGELP